ncbi:ATP-binding protein [Streptomyces sp. NBC_01451]|uniref:ATP-binding protein n=1 Tax=Streptomyces sp. NBC_01451 TaxID=2903872 RepID=UPI002E37E461|nr:ATP-binding protein [Streptomyces sp. NBC_01451]
MIGPLDETENANPFGVYVPESRDRLPATHVRPKADHPLVPWKEQSHVHQWVDVDHAGQQLVRFEECFQEELPGLLVEEEGRGHLVVVTGPVGMGKTTLIHRCVHWAHEYVQGLARPVVAMAGGYQNLGDKVSWDPKGHFAETPLINTFIRDRIVRKLEKEFPGEPLDPVLTGDDVQKAFSGISKLLARQESLLFAIVPHIDWRDAGGEVRTNFLKTWLSHAESRIVLFVEISHQNRETAGEVIAGLPSNMPVTHLSLGSLATEDTVKFTETARGGHPDPESTPPSLPAIPTQGQGSGSGQAQVQVQDPWSLADVRHLRRECFAIAKEQRERGEAVHVTAAHLTPPTIDPSAMGRAPRRPA